MRTRWAAIGAAVAVTLGAGGVSLTQAALGSGSKPVFVAITPCRLVDTRPGPTNIGSRATPLGANDTLTLQVTGAPGACTGIPADATAAAMNVTAIQGSTRSYLTLYPADARLPNASNLNWNGGDPPTPNKVDVKLSSGGAVKITNNAGTVHVAADLVGYYVDHTHDDRYYTETEIDAGLAQKANTSNVYTKSQIDSAMADIEDALAQKADASNTYTKSQLYTKAQVDSGLAQIDARLDQLESSVAGKADQSTTYTKAEIDAFLAADGTSVTTETQVGSAVGIGTSATTIVSASITPPADGDVIALGIAPGNTGTGYQCSLSTDGNMDPSSTQAGGPNDGQIVPVRGFAVTSGALLTVNLVCRATSGTVDITGASIRLIYFPD